MLLVIGEVFMKQNQLIIIMTISLGLLMFPLYIISFNRQQLLFFGTVYLVDRLITACTGGAFSHALTAIEQKVDSGIDVKESKKFGNFLLWMIGWIILVVIIYVYILVTNLPLFIMMMSGELMDKLIEIILKKMRGHSH